MAKRGKQERFSQTWVTQTQLGKRFNLSARSVGQLLVDLGLRDYDAAQGQYVPSQRAVDEQLCVATPLKDGTPFFMWNKRKVAEMIEQKIRVPALSEREVEHYELAQELIRLAREADETGFDKPYFLLLDSIPQRDFASINTQLERLGTALRLGVDEDADRR